MPLLAAQESVLLVVDAQSRLVPALAGAEQLLSKVAALARAARLLGVPVMATEHWADKLGGTEEAIAAHVDRVVHKREFDGSREGALIEALPEGRPRVLVAGAEAHICVLQTGLGLGERGLVPVLVSDCVGSRREEDRQAALSRWAHHGWEAVTAEMAMYEWLQTPAHPAFREVLELIREDR